jgi:DNA-binding IclR family transcriptional regulator
MRPLHEQPQLAVLFDPTCRTVFERISRSSANAADLARELDLPPVDVRRCLAELVGAGLVAPLRGERYGVAASGLASIRREIEDALQRRAHLRV